MSVHRSDRKVAFMEFVRQMALVHRHTHERLRSLPARYKRYIVPKISKPLNGAYVSVILANEQNAKSNLGSRQRAALFERSVQQLREVQEPLVAYWNLCDVTEAGSSAWAEMFNREFALIYGVAKMKGKPPMFFSMPRRKIEKLAFLKKMCLLHKFTYQKLGHAPEYTRDGIGEPISKFINNALFNVFDANNIVPTTRIEADRREKRLQAAIDSLNALQTPLLALWNIMDYSESIMDEWAGLLDEELRLLEGLKKADRERYKDLR